MIKSFALNEVDPSLSSLVTRLAEDGETALVDGSGRRVAILVPPDEFDRYVLARAWERVREIQDRNAHRDPDEILAEVTEIVEEVRQEMYDADIRAKSSH